MACYFENFGLDFLNESEDTLSALVKCVLSEGKAITGYSGLPYFNRHFGDVQVIARVGKREDGTLEVTGLDMHSAGRCVWDVRLSGIAIDRKNADKMEKRCVVNKKDGSGMAIVNIVNADVLPSFREDEEITLQMVAFPEAIHYYENEEEYERAEEAKGSKFLAKNGGVVPTGFLHNRNPENDDFDSDDHLDDLTLMRGTVKTIEYGSFGFAGKKENTYILTRIETEFGDVEIVHSVDDVDEDEEKNIKVGAEVSGVFVLSGDAAIYEYENGVVFDEEHDLIVLRDALEGTYVDRLYRIMTDDTRYLSENTGADITGREKIIEKIKEISKNAKDAGTPCFAQCATIISVDEGEEELPYGVDKRCLVLSYTEKDNYEAIGFIETDDDGRISKFVISTNSRYHFCIDEKTKRKSILDDVDMPDSVYELMVNRAKFHGFLEDDITVDMVISDIENFNMYKDNAEILLDLMPCENEEEEIENIFGYLFAKAIEGEYTNRLREETMESGIIVNYNPVDVWSGNIGTMLDKESHERIVYAMEKGRQFYKDFSFLYTEFNIEDGTDKLVEALITVQQIGYLCEYKYMS